MSVNNLERCRVKGVDVLPLLLVLLLLTFRDSCFGYLRIMIIITTIEWSI